MNRKWIGVVLAVALAALGTWVLVRYVQSAEARALEGQETIEVLVVTEPVPAGSSIEDIAARVTPELVPVKVQAPGSLGTLNSLSGMVAAVDLVPGEQLLESRLTTAEEYFAEEKFTVPEGLVEVTISLAPERAVGGELRPGDLVAVFSSFEPFDLDGVEPSGDDQIIVSPDTAEEAQQVLDALGSAAQTPNSTHLIIHKVVVTNVQVEQLPPTAAEDDATDQVALAPTGNRLVTLAMEPQDAERYIFTAEFGTVWLAAESPTAPEDTTDVQTRNSVYVDPPADEEDSQ